MHHAPTQPPTLSIKNRQSFYESNRNFKAYWAFKRARFYSLSELVFFVLGSFERKAIHSGSWVLHSWPDRSESHGCTHRAL